MHEGDLGIWLGETGRDAGCESDVLVEATSSIIVEAAPVRLDDVTMALSTI